MVELWSYKLLPLRMVMSNYCHQYWWYLSITVIFSPGQVNRNHQYCQNDSPLHYLPDLLAKMCETVLDFGLSSNVCRLIIGIDVNNLDLLLKILSEVIVCSCTFIVILFANGFCLLLNFLFQYFQYFQHFLLSLDSLLSVPPFNTFNTYHIFNILSAVMVFCCMFTL